MNFKFSKGSDEPSQAVEEVPKKSQSALAVLLLILVAGVGYIYFFTDMIKSNPEAVSPPAPAPQVIKKPLPPRDGVAIDTKDVVPAAATVKSIPTPITPASVVKKDIVTAKPVLPVAKTPVPTKTVVATPIKTPIAKVVEKKSLPVTEKNAEQKKTDLKPVPVISNKKVAPVKAADTKSSDLKKSASNSNVKPSDIHKKTTVQELARKEAGTWTVQVGSYVLEEALAADLVRVRKAGLDANVVSGGRKKTSMNRLFVAEFTEHAAGQAELDKLKKYTSDAFMVDHDGKFMVYAGSYLLDSRVASEKERLSAAGYHLTVKRVDIAIPTKVLNAGIYTDKKRAEDAVKKLKAAGIKAILK